MRTLLLLVAITSLVACKGDEKKAAAPDPAAKPAPAEPAPAAAPAPATPTPVAATEPAPAAAAPAKGQAECQEIVAKLFSCAADKAFAAKMSKAGGLDFVTESRKTLGSDAELCNLLQERPVAVPNDGQFDHEGGLGWTDDASLAALSAAAKQDCAAFGAAIKKAGGLPTPWASE